MSSYAALADFFLSLRGQGISLASADLEVLEKWDRCGVDPVFVARVMEEMQKECLDKSKPFPKHLAPIARRVNSLLRPR